MVKLIDVSSKLANSGKSEAAGKKADRRGIVRSLSDVWRAIYKKDVRLLVRMGLGDPAETGQLWVVLGPLSGMFATDLARRHAHADNRLIHGQAARENRIEPIHCQPGGHLNGGTAGSGRSTPSRSSIAISSGNGRGSNLW